MGCDFYADENGEFEIYFWDYKTSRKLRTVLISGLKSNHPIGQDIIKGRVR